MCAVHGGGLSNSMGRLDAWKCRIRTLIMYVAGSEGLFVLEVVRRLAELHWVQDLGS